MHFTGLLLMWLHSQALSPFPVAVHVLRRDPRRFRWPVCPATARWHRRDDPAGLMPVSWSGCRGITFSMSSSGKRSADPCCCRRTPGDDCAGHTKFCKNQTGIFPLARLYMSGVDPLSPASTITTGNFPDNTCTSCGTCAAICPAKYRTGWWQTGSLQHQPPVLCWRAVYLCPGEAIQAGKMAGRARYSNPEVNDADFKAQRGP